MNDFFSNMVSRHLGTCDTIQPRTLGRFEVDSSRGGVDSPDESINSVISGINVPAGTINESDLKGAKKDDSTVTVHGSDLMGSKKNESSLPHLELNEPSTQLGLTEQQEVPPDFHALPTRPDETHPFDEVVCDFEPPATEHALDEQGGQQYESQISIPSEKRTSLLNAAVSLDSAPTSERQTNRQNAEHDPENELDHRIRAMLQRLVGGSGSPVTEPALDEQSSQHYQDQISVPSEEKHPLLNAAVVSLDSAPTSEGQINRQNNVSADGEGENTSLYDSLEPPSWLAEIENRFNTPLKDIEAKTEPVINVTIGRVEVRAVQAEASRKTRHAKKPTGVMPLDEYLKKREDRGM